MNDKPLTRAEKRFFILWTIGSFVVLFLFATFMDGVGAASDGYEMSP